MEQVMLLVYIVVMIILMPIGSSAGIYQAASGA